MLLHHTRSKRPHGATLSAIPAPPLPQMSLSVDGAPNLPFTGTTTGVHVEFTDGTAPRYVEMSRDGNANFAFWVPNATAYNATTAYAVADTVLEAGTYYACISPATGIAPPNATYWKAFSSGSSTFFTARDPLLGIDGDWCISQSCWGNVDGAHVLYATGTYAGGTAINVSVNLTVADAPAPPPPPPAPPPPAPPPNPVVLRVETVATDGYSGDRGITWSYHAPRHTLHTDDTERILYTRGATSGASRNWRLMKRDAGTGVWSQEATAQSDHDFGLVRTSDDKAHVIGTPASASKAFTTYSSPGFTASTVPGSWPTQANAYQGFGINASTNELIVTTQFDIDLATNQSGNVDRRWAEGTWNGSSWAWNAIVSKNLPERHAYTFVFPSAFAANEQVHIELRDVSKSVAGLPNISSSWVWDGVRMRKTGHTSAATFNTYQVMDKLTPASSQTAPAWYMYGTDAYIDTSNRVWAFHIVSDQGGAALPAGAKTPGTYLSVFDSSGNLLNTPYILTGSGYVRIFEDSQNRVWIFRASLATGPTVKLLLMNTSAFTIQATYDLTSSFAGVPCNRPFIACKRTGSSTDLYLSGHLASGSTITAFKIQLPA